MSVTNMSSNIIDPTLLLIPYQLNIYLGLFIFITGNISWIGNIIVFSSRNFRGRACSIYLIAESYFNFLYFDYVLVIRMIQKGFRLPIINRYDVVCKIRQFLSQYTHQVAFTLITLATIDRLLSTHRSIGFYAKLDMYFEAIMSGVCPPTVLLILGCALLRNVRQVGHRRVMPTSTSSRAPAVNLSYIQQMDAQLTKMLLLQSFVAIPSFFPFGAQNLYSSITEDWYKSPLRIAWENVFIELIRLFSYLFYSTSFYVSFFTSRGFRKAVFQVLRIELFQKPTDPIKTHVQMISTNVTRKIEHKPA
ncbi:unnamed protein product [Rotaria sp. Silwood1]|nr:unnamed protein product [Rotaria sp. Silwood1]CAF4991038.1 unnamed protein product [Rotaria sp. Silwood1]CAF5005633.1 unnamed protein product [Rotaria sp. Silwood1]